MSGGGGGGGGGQDPSYYYNIERDRQQAAMNEARLAQSRQEALVRDQMAQQKKIADDLAAQQAAQQAEQKRQLEAEAARVAAEKAAQDAENARKAQETETRRRNRTLGGVQSFATNGYAGFGGAGRTLGTTSALG